MRVTYLKHSGFLVEWEDIACIFDWTEGELPPLDASRRVFVFASHSHGDHFSPDLFVRCAALPRRTYVLSYDIRPAPPEKEIPVIRMGPEQRRIIAGGEKGVMSVTTLRSTDQGVAFVVNYAGKTVYHAGDLHWWAWPDDTPEEEKRMKNAFAREILKLKGLPLDAAFLPLDPRLEDNFWLGFDAVMRTALVRKAFPMHMWERYEFIETLRELPASEPYRAAIVSVAAPGETFEI